MRQLLYVILLLISCSRLTANVESSLKKIPFEEQYYLRVFFRDFFLHDNLGHVLFFHTKPVCLMNLVLAKKQHYLEKCFLKGWTSWKKYEHLFPHPGFLFIEEEFCVEDMKLLHIYLINKETLLACLHQHEALFKSVLGDPFSPELFLTELEQGQTLTSLIKDDECLRGLILGYDLQSAMAFKKENSETQAIPLWREDYQGIDVQAPKRCMIFPVGFMGNPQTPEVENLVQRYEEELEELWAKYKSSKNTLKLVLERLCDGLHHVTEAQGGVGNNEECVQ